MNSFEEASGVETEGIVQLWPYLESISHDGKFILTSNGTLARRFQLQYGDAILAGENDSFWAIEIKIEHKHTGNLFLETFSNRNLDNREDHAQYGVSIGWLYKLVADRLLYYFIDTGDLYNIDIFQLKHWAFSKGRIYKFSEVPQRKYEQKNDTWGRLVPVEVLERELTANRAFMHIRLPKHSEAAA